MKRLTPYLFLLPTFLFLGFFAYVPFFSAFLLALYRSDGLGEHTFVGLSNFIELMSDPLFWHGFSVMGYFALGLPLAVLGPLAGAMLIHNVRISRLAYLYRSALVIPVVVPMITVVLIWRDFYGPEGAINRILGLIGLDAFTTTWLGNTSTVIPAMIFMGVPWLGGINMLLFLAGLINIPRSLYEAARIDGAGCWQVLWHIEAPLLLPQFRTVAILVTLGLVQSYESILVMTAGGPSNVTLVPGLYLFRNSFEFGRVGYASALGLVLFAISLALTLFNMRVFRKHGY